MGHPRIIFLFIPNQYSTIAKTALSKKKKTKKDDFKKKSWIRERSAAALDRAGIFSCQDQQQRRLSAPPALKTSSNHRLKLKGRDTGQKTRK